MIITGIGSRETPPFICEEMKLIGEWCRKQGVSVRSGHADGADYAFESGALQSCQVYLPWPEFNKNLPMLGVPVLPPMSLSEEDRLLRLRLDEMVRAYHPAPHSLNLTPRGLALQRRNGQQVLGTQCDKPANAIVCWTPRAAVVGGTGQALRIAAAYSVPVINMAHSEYGSGRLVVRRLLALQ